MGLISWILTGLIAGGIARWIVKDERAGCIYTMIVGIIGAVLGGWMMGGVNDFSLRSLGVSIIGAVLLLLILNAIAGFGPSKRRGA